MQKLAYVHSIPELAPILQGANHIDVKTVTGNCSLNEFVTAMLSYQPGWVTFLYRVRAGFVRLLGMRQLGMPKAVKVNPANLPMQTGSQMSFFKVRLAEPERFWVAEAEDKHLKAALGVVVELLASGQKRFHTITIVHYHNWTGPVYFNVIRPFHHLVVGAMVKAGVEPYQKATA